MLPFWSRFKHGVLQNLTATYFRGLFVVLPSCTKNNVPFKRSFSFQNSLWWPQVSRRNKSSSLLMTVGGGGVCLLMVPGSVDYFSTRLLNQNNTQICNYFYLFSTNFFIFLSYKTFQFSLCVN